jgi:hypothetical protein
MGLQETLRKLLREVAGDPTPDLDRIAPLLGQILPQYMQGPYPGKHFQMWESHGVHVTPVHYYSPIPDTRTLPDSLWNQSPAHPGIDFNEAGQLRYLRDVFPRYQEEYDLFPSAPTSVPYQFHFNNPAFDGTDALVLYCFVRHFRPRRVVEVGSGYSSRVSAQAAGVNGDTQLICIEPYPAPELAQGFPGMTRLITKPVQEVDLALFQSLAAGDILFIDSSHVVKCGSDVNFLFLQVIPSLQPGVLVHVHDIFLPDEFPQGWIKQQHLFWNEQYLLQAFLTFNSEFEIVFSNALMGKKHLADMQKTFPKSQPWWGGSSFWMRRRPR